MADVGAAAGVSDRTVSNVLSGKIPVSAETREVVMRAVDLLGYRINTVARNLRTGRTGSITLAVPDLSVDYFSQLAAAVVREADARGLAVTVEQTGYERSRELQVLRGSGGHLSDGLIFQPHALDRHDLDELPARDRQPVVLLGDHRPGLPLDHITMANTASAQTATEHLAAIGRRRIAAIGVNSVGGPHTAEGLRLEGYRSALLAAGIAFDPGLVAEASRWRLSDGAAALDGLLERGVHFDGLFCFNDSLALGALRALARRGMRVPEDVAIVGFDNIPAAEYSNPPLTSIDPGGAEIARAALDVLMRRLQGDFADQPVTFLSPYRLVIRTSA